MYGMASKYYDKLYGSKDYRAEANRVVEAVRQRMPSAKSLLDVACGTAAHLEYLQSDFTVEGLDLSEDLLNIARARLPTVRFYVADMTNFSLGKKFDAVTCMFSSIGYAKTLERLRATVRCMALHLERGGVLVVEPWFSEKTWNPKPVYATFVDEPTVKIARISTNRTEGRVSVIQMEYLIGTEEGVEHFSEIHEMGLFSDEETREAFELAELECEYQEEGMSGKGLYIGRLR